MASLTNARIRLLKHYLSVLEEQILKAESSLKFLLMDYEQLVGIIKDIIKELEESESDPWTDMDGTFFEDFFAKWTDRVIVSKKEE